MTLGKAVSTYSFLVALLLANPFQAFAQKYENGRVICSERAEPQGDSRIVSFKEDGTDRKVLVREGLNIHPSVSRNGENIIFSRRMDNGNLELFQILVNGGPLRQLTRGTKGGNIKPVVSPDGSKIAFMGIRHNIGHPEVWIMSLDDKRGIQQLTRTSAVKGQQKIRGKLHISSGHPSFSHDGQKIYYSSTQSGSVQIWTMNTDGSEKRQLTFGIDKEHPQANVPNISFDGRYAVFWAGHEGRFGEIWLVKNGEWRNPIKITETTNPANSDDPVISPDGKKVVYGSGIGGNRSMYILNIVTGKIHLLAKDMQFCSWQPVRKE